MTINAPPVTSSSGAEGGAAASASGSSSISSRKLRVCVLQSTYEGSNAAVKDLDPDSVPEVYDVEGKYEWSSFKIHKARAVQQVRELSRQGYDVFLNLCDGAYDEDRAGKEVVEALERFGCAYTGADLNFYEPSKALMKKVAYYYSIKTPGFAFIMDVDEADDAAAADQCCKAVEGLKWPLIVKHHNGYGSVGMGRDCKVHDVQQLVAQVRKFVGSFGGALVEEFIAGREFTVLVAEDPQGGQEGEPRVYTPVEMKFSAGETFKSFDVKWVDYECMAWQQLDTAAEPKLDAALRSAAKAAFTALQGVSYGRSDFRVDEQGNCYFLEINPNCGVFAPRDNMASVDFILDMDTELGGAQGFIDGIIQAALRRAAAHRHAKTTEVRYSHGWGYGLYAVRPLAAGEVVVQYEEKPHVLVSKQHVKRTWQPDSLKAQWFESYAFPVSEDLFVTWSEDPEEWLPINHSCDPNCWLVGLDLVARRPIPAGQQITMEYATFCGPNMAPFDCQCGASSCRRRVGPGDHLAAWLGEVYGRDGEHMSSWVAAARRRVL